MNPVDRIIDYTAKTESGGAGGYASLTLDDAGAGISFGFIQFNQKMGGLAALFKEMSLVDPAGFNECFGDYAPSMVSESWVKKTDLAHNPVFVARLRASGIRASFQKAQRNLARRLYFNPIVATVKRIGLNSERAYAMAFDTAVQRGPGSSNALLLKAAASAKTPREILSRFAILADTTTRVGRVDRRSKMLDDGHLSDAPLDLENADG